MASFPSEFQNLYLSNQAVSDTYIRILTIL